MSFENDDFAGRQCRGELCLDPGFEGAAVRRSVDDTWRGQAMASSAAMKVCVSHFPREHKRQSDCL
ncbi:hypothetical protein [Agrobacterium larrymoorei]|uniref:hypothetical protein n=1 Tax=Agrobacterium larrymoorei TaxID=160699 RepID=UPI0027D7F0D8|nr:hypothetical protein [Agrobacterium larrymoorei]